MIILNLTGKEVSLIRLLVDNFLHRNENNPCWKRESKLSKELSKRLAIVEGRVKKKRV